jgi:aryl-alcohol dehydrogenase-like predicted oxidoreductase
VSREVGPRAAVPRIELAPGYDVARIIHGGWQLSAGHRPQGVGAAAALRTLSRLADAGFTTFDCADIYTGVEELLGRFLAGRRPGSIQVHTKLVPDADVLASISKGYVERIVDRSLTRLGVERLDLVQFHWWDFAVPGWVETAAWLDELRRAGKIRLLGVTNFDVPHLEEVLDAGVEVVSNQVQYSLLDRRPERGMADLCARRGLRLLCYGTLAGGFLSGRYLGRGEPEEPLANRSLVKYRLIVDEFGGWPALQELLAALDVVAKKHAAGIAAVATRWTLDRPGVGAAILGVGRSDRLAEALRVFDLRLDAQDHQRLDQVLEQHPGPEGDVYSVERVPGGRHAAVMRTRLNREA